MKAFYHYYLTINSISLPASVLIALIAGINWLPIVFCTFGLAMGLVAYNLLFKNQYYFYYNLGFTKTKLAFNVFGLNCIVAVLMFLIIKLF
jgi:hypothetical protein